ncbi:MAG: NifU family protein [Brumimicrobium sp.]|nr:NifU family protein [Brumimicrobium sp.]
MGKKDLKEIEKTVQEALDQLRPYLEQDGGDMELVEVTSDYVVKVKLLGNCSTCSMSSMTMKAGLEEAVKKVVPEIVRVEAVD